MPAGMIIKGTIKAAGAVGERGLVKAGVSKGFAEESKVVFEATNGTITDAIAVQYSNSNSGLSKTEQVAVSTFAEMLLANLVCGAVGAVATVARPVPWTQDKSYAVPCRGPW